MIERKEIFYDLNLDLYRLFSHAGFISKKMTNDENSNLSGIVDDIGCTEDRHSTLLKNIRNELPKKFEKKLQPTINFRVSNT